MLAGYLRPFVDPTYAALRILAGLLFAFHGIQKLTGFMTDSAAQLGSQMWIGGVIELTCGLLIALGLFTVWAAFLASGTMAVAYIQFHWKFQFDANFFPRINNGELALVYSFVFLFMAAYGPGRWSLDERRGSSLPGGS